MTAQRIHVPTAWSAEQARTVAEFLDEVSGLVWALYDELGEPDGLDSETTDETPRNAPHAGLTRPAHDAVDDIPF